MSKPWKPTALLQASFLVHGLAGVALLTQPATWPWAVGALAANHLLLTGAGMAPRSALLGPNLTHLPPSAGAYGHIALTFDDGPDPKVTPRVLDLLDAAGARASFFCIGRRARQHPQLVREIAARGHRVENHGDSHSHRFATFGPRHMRTDIQAAQDTLTELTGTAPRFFRPTAGLRNPFLDPVLHRLGLLQATWTRRGFDTRTGQADKVWQRLSRNLRAGDILLLHDGHVARTDAGEAVCLAVLPRLLQTISRNDWQAVTLAEAQ